MRKHARNEWSTRFNRLRRHEGSQEPVFIAEVGLETVGRATQLLPTEIRCDGITINYPSQDRDADRLRQIEELATFTVDYVARPVFESGPCVGVTLDGVSQLPPCKVEVLCHVGAAGNRADQVLEYHASNWRKGGRISLQSRGVLEWCPDTFDVTLTIDGFTTPIVRKGLKASSQR